jgi:hypothetical protein
MENAIGILLNMNIPLGTIDILAILILPLHGHDVSFHLFVFIQFVNIL